MSEPSKYPFKAIPVVVVAIVVLVAAGIGISRIGKPDGENPDKEKAGDIRSAKSSPRSAEGRTNGSSVRKSAGKSDEERKGKGVAAVIRTGGNRREMMIQVSVAAREELIALRKKHATEFESPEVRRAFSAQLSQIKSVEERQRLLQERTHEMRRARDAADAAKGFADRAREKELIVLMQVQSLHRMAEFVAKSPAMRNDADAYVERLAAWVEEAASGRIEEVEFQTSFTQLRNDLNELRRRNAQHSVATPNHPRPLQSTPSKAQ